jgi:hypothetical protein
MLVSEMAEQNPELEAVIRTLRKLEPILTREYKVAKIGVFGSLVRGEQTGKSDVDILVEFSEPIGLKFFDLQEFLERKLRRKVDLVSTGAISPYIRPYIEREVVFA